MNTQFVKAVTNNLTGYALGAAAAEFLRSNRRHSDKVAVELLIDVATFVTAGAIAGVIHEPVRAYTDAQIDKGAALIERLKGQFQK